jgi:hypothetical protein
MSGKITVMRVRGLIDFKLLLDERVLTYSSDLFIRLWDSSGLMTNCVNLAHPLPTRWDSNTQSERQTLTYALKLLNIIQNKYVDESELSVLISQALDGMSRRRTSKEPIKVM